MKYSEFKRWLEKQGATFENSRSGTSHLKVTLNGVTVPFPYHGANEMGKGLENQIMKQLKLK